MRLPADFAALEGLESAAYQWIATADEDFVAEALSELVSIDRGGQTRHLAAGVILIDGTRSFAEIAEEWAAAPPIFVRHICPVQAAVRLPAVADLALLETTVATEIAPYLAAGAPFSVQTRVFGAPEIKPFDINQRLSVRIGEMTGLVLDVRAPEQVISVVVVADEGGLLAYAGASATAHNLSDWAGGVRRFAREEGQISRAEFKLLEALEVFGLQLTPRGHVLDLGAAPGGWTRVLRRLEQYVTAVDPAELDARLAGDRGVRHKRMTAERYLADGPDTFDAIVNDMRQDARDSARLMVAYAPYLYPHGWALMTLKLPAVKRRAILEQALAVLRDSYTIAGARQLFHNRSEITVLLRPRE